MCTLTYRLTAQGYELFFNRDEQRSRSQAIPPVINNRLNAIYPIDPVGEGTWLAVHESGCTLALLNYYQAEKSESEKASLRKKYVSRGEIILKLLKEAPDVAKVLKTMSLDVYQPFQLCLFPAGLTLFDKQPQYFQWDGITLTEQQQQLPITSSSVDYPQVYQARKALFNLMVDGQNPTTKQFINYHASQQQAGKLSVNMSRSDAKTVSFSHISITDTICFKYCDYQDQLRYEVVF